MALSLKYLPGGNKVLSMNDKVVKYTILFLAAATWVFLMFLLWGLLQKVAVDSSLLNQLIGVLEAIGTGAIGWFARHYLTTGKQGGTSA